MNREDIMAALRTVHAPGGTGNIVDRLITRDIVVKDEMVRLTLALPEQRDDEADALRRAVDEELRKTGAKDIHIRIRAMTDRELDQFNGSTQVAKPGQVPPGAKPKGPTPGVKMLSPDSGVEFIAIASGKGGVGKSTVTVNLAIALAEQGHKVGIIDADIYGFSIPDMMGLEGQPELVDDLIIPVQKRGVKVISMGFFVEDNAPVVWRGPMLGKMLDNFFKEVNWGELDYMLIDLPPGTGDVALDIHHRIPHSKEIVVTTPHATASFVAARAGAMALQTDHEILGVVENMAYYECSACGNRDYVFGRGGGGKLAEELHTELLAQIPLGAPGNSPTEADYGPSIYDTDSATGLLYQEMAKKVHDKVIKNMETSK